MPLRNDLLNPISADKPAGENLRYAPVYDKIKEARREDDDAPQGDWKRERKVADWPVVIKLISESLAAKTKDLQLAAWLTEAMLNKEGVAGLREVLELIADTSRISGTASTRKSTMATPSIAPLLCNGSAIVWKCS